MTNKVYAKVNSFGDIVSYPLYESGIKSIGHSVNNYVAVDTSDKPEENEFQTVTESIQYIPALNIVKATYTVTDKGIDYIFGKLNNKIPDPEDPTNEEKATPYVPNETDLEYLQKAVVKKVEEELDGLAHAKQYDNIVSLIGYINSTDANFKAEAEYGNNIRSITYRNLYNYLGRVLAQEENIPLSWEEIVEKASLPACNWDAYVAPGQA